MWPQPPPVVVQCPHVLDVRDLVGFAGKCSKHLSPPLVEGVCIVEAKSIGQHAEQLVDIFMRVPDGQKVDEDLAEHFCLDEIKQECKQDRKNTRLNSSH